MRLLASWLPRRLLFAGMLVSAGCGLRGQAAQASRAPLAAGTRRTAAPAISEALVYQAPDRAEIIGHYAVGDHLLWILNRDGKKSVWLDGQQSGGTYDDVRYVTYWPDVERLAYVGKRRSRLVLVVDGVASSTDYKNMGEPAIDPAGRVLVPAARQGKFRLLIDGEESGPEYDDLWPPRLSPDGKHSLSFAQRNGRQFAVLDGQQLGPELLETSFLSIHNLNTWHLHNDMDERRFSVSGSMYAPDPPLEYQCARMQPGARSRFVVYPVPLWTADSMHTLFPARVSEDRSHWKMIVDGVPGPSFDSVGEIGFSKDGQHMAYALARLDVGIWEGQSTLLVEDGRSFQSYPLRFAAGAGPSRLLVTKSFCNDYFATSDLQYAADGSLIYARQVGNDVVVTFKGTDGPKVAAVRSAIALSEDRNHIRYSGLMQVDKKLELVEIEDHAVRAHLAEVPSRVGWRTSVTILDRNANSFGYDILVEAGFRFFRGETGRARRRFVINSKPGPTYDATGMWGKFSEDGGHHFYVVEGAQQDRDLVVFDGCEGKLYDSVLEESIRFKSANAVEYIARQGNQLLRVTMQCK